MDFNHISRRPCRAYQGGGYNGDKSPRITLAFVKMKNYSSPRVVCRYNKCPTWLFYIIAGVLFSNLWANDDTPTNLSVPEANTVILVAERSEYFPLAQEISSMECFPIYHTLEDCFHSSPDFLIWVAAPKEFSESALMHFGKELAKIDTCVGVGIISGNSISQARILWSRDQYFVANNLAYFSLSEGIVLKNDSQIVEQELTSENVVSAVSGSQYIHYSGHGTSRSWGPFQTTMVPSLNNAVVSAASCQTFRPWISDNIALKMVDSGAVCYVGFPWSPIGDYFMGDKGGFPFQFSSPDFPIGHIVSVLGKGTQKVFARFPQTFMLGDPRIYLTQSSVRTVSDTTKDHERTIIYNDCPDGIIPIRVKGAAQYSFVEAVGITSSSDADLFYNRFFQFANNGSDKFILVESQGDELILKLKTSTPFLWFIDDTTQDLADLCLPVAIGSNSLIFVGVMLCLPLVCWRLWKQRKYVYQLPPQ